MRVGIAVFCVSFSLYVSSSDLEQPKAFKEHLVHIAVNNASKEVVEYMEKVNVGQEVGYTFRQLTEACNNDNQKLLFHLMRMNLYVYTQAVKADRQDVTDFTRNHMDYMYGWWKDLYKKDAFLFKPQDWQSTKYKNRRVIINVSVG